MALFVSRRHIKSKSLKLGVLIEEVRKIKSVQICSLLEVAENLQ